jgi:hypothetical protein
MRHKTWFHSIEKERVGCPHPRPLSDRERGEWAGGLVAALSSESAKP